MNPLDLYAAPDVSDAEEAAYERAVDRIASFDGKALFESGNFQMDDTDGMFDMYNLPRVFDSRRCAGKAWDDLDTDEQGRWSALAATLRDFALDRLDPDRVAYYADRI